MDRELEFYAGAGEAKSHAARQLGHVALALFALVIMGVIVAELIILAQ